MSFEEETMKFDVLLVGGGPASLICAIHLVDLIKKHNHKIKAKKNSNEDIIDIEDKIAIIEKGAYFGAHNISGAIMDPKSIREIMPDFEEIGFPIESKVKENYIYLLSKKKQFRLPPILTPKYLKNKNNYIVSIGKVCSWLAEEANKKGIVLLPNYTAKELLFDKQNRVLGIKTDAKRWDKNKYNEPPLKLLSKLTVLGEGANGNLSQTLIKKLKLDEDKYPMTYELGCKEIWKLKNKQKGAVIHTVGYPLNLKRIGGAFIYGIDNDKIALGLFTKLSTKDPKINIHKELQRLKAHPLIASMIQDGKVISYGAKVVSAGGYTTIPKLAADNAIIIGEAAGLLNIKRLKGIHLAIKSGTLAAKVLFEAIKKKDYSQKTLEKYESLLKQSSEYKELLDNSKIKGIIKKITTKINKKNKYKKDFEKTIPVKNFYNKKQNTEYPDSKLSSDKLSSVYLANTKHNENEPSNIQIKNKEICSKQCYPVYKAPCTEYCPANVYELNDKKEINIRFSNCIHCKAADIKCPFDNIIWKPPQGGYGPRYKSM